MPDCSIIISAENSVQNRIGGNSHYAYLNLQSGLNIGAWRLRDNTTWSYNSSDRSSGSKNKWQHINTWLEREHNTVTFPADAG